MNQRWVVALATGLLGWCVARPACAEVSVLIVTPADDSVDYSLFENRLRSELLTSGFTVSSARVLGRPDNTSLARDAERAFSQAAISIAVTDGELCGLLWIAESRRTTGLQRPVRCCPLNDQAPIVFAVRATDALSAGLLELRYQSDESHPAVAAESSVSSSVARARPLPQQVPAQALKSPQTPDISARQAQTNPTPSLGSDRTSWHVQAAGAAAGWFRNLPLSFGGKLHVERAVSSSWTVGVQAFILGPTVFTRDAGQARVMQLLGGFTVRYATRLNQWFSLVDGIGGGLYEILVYGDAVPPHQAQSAFASSGYFAIEHAIRFRATNALALTLGCELLTTWNRYDVVIADSIVARAAAPMAIGSLGLQLSF